MKKIIVFLIDSFMPEALEEVLKQNKVPLFKELIKRGNINRQCVTVFPTMSASFDASLITGVTPGIHKIPGLVWYSKKENRIINYGAPAGFVFKLGVSQVIADTLYNQNTKHLAQNIKTIFEELDFKGYTSGSFSYQVYRGHHIHKIKFPWYMKPFSKKTPKHISGPNQIILGRFLNSLDKNIKAPKSLFSRLGLNDKFTIEAFISTVQENKQPDFSLLYLPKTDQDVHKNHLEGGIEGLTKVNTLLEQVVSTYGSLDKALEENIFILTGDHSQIKVHHFIYLDSILKNFKYPALKDKITFKHDLILCNNERMAFIYYREEYTADKIIKELIKDPGIDLVARKSGGWIYVYNDSMDRYFSFKRGENYVDEYEQSWDISGDFNILDLLIDRNKIKYRMYPDALNLLESAIISNDSSVIIANAKPTYMFKSESSSNYKGGGSHGGLNQLEMHVPFIISEKTDLPLPRRLIEVKEYILSLLEAKD
ncbi:Predicted pyrophosphatase or phosphodiesterase, AlkP superfamily [Desulfonispora thiosulfatigenes DSM 11270]|uniref:Predicted pyrophosphatase or phosphodiesterase, AlkP superfamily n=1 Tax=Desulfonispora thiosulfatigenes DSM 11270 TaxID=656914 RepID=A0A1W1V1B5_DESTI|nr:alkaline phosphatase family protein [Desulfonispora thiosulfatigenes]SMB86791.1 Predicted pyrophosphatase or phosphodiesterase, AlkP superfamily [Desulfonispora thiosulfatigenes DSM 11270]